MENNGFLRKHLSTKLMLAAALLLSVLVLLQSLGVFNPLGQDLQLARSFALEMADFNLENARSMGVGVNNVRVTLAHRRLVDSIERAISASEIYHIVMTDMSRFERVVIREEADRAIIEELRLLIAADPNLNQGVVGEVINIRFAADRTVELEGGHFLDDETLELLETFVAPDALRLQTVSFKVTTATDDGEAELAVVQQQLEEDILVHLENQHSFWEQELASLQAVAGHAALSGPGVVIRLWDAPREVIESGQNYVHAYDVQEVVHYLFAHGAQGVSVGNRRLVATSAIRCLGGPIQVNNMPVSVDPVVIVAVGNPEEMLAGLAELLDYYQEQRALQVETEIQQDLRLPAYRPR